MDELERIKGSLYGIATGDALGAPLEGVTKSRVKITEMIGGGTDHLRPGQWTDETQMTLCLLEGLLEDGGYALEKVIKKYLDWWKQKPIGIGKGCNLSLDFLSKGNSVWSASRLAHEAMNGLSGGSGSLMRCAPIAFFYYRFQVDLIKATVTDAKITHWDDRVGTASLIQNLLLSELFLGEKNKKMALQTIFYYLQGRDPQVDRILTNLPNIEEEDLKTDGFVLNLLQLVLWYFINTNTFEECIVSVVNRGGEADTAGSVAGALAGAYYGYSAIPTRWLNTLDKKDQIDHLVSKLPDVSKQNPHRPYC